MKLCLKCQRELFDFDLKCDTCGSDTLLSSSEIESIKDELIKANKIQRNRLLKIEKYYVVNQYMLKTLGDKYWVNTKSYSSDAKRSLNENKAEIICPYCKSNNTSKITATSKAVNTVVFGIFGTKRHKQWHCNNCKSDF